MPSEQCLGCYDVASSDNRRIPKALAQNRQATPLVVIEPGSPRAHLRSQNSTLLAQIVDDFSAARDLSSRRSAATERDPRSLAPAKLNTNRFAALNVGEPVFLGGPSFWTLVRCRSTREGRSCRSVPVLRVGTLTLRFWPLGLLP